MRPRGLSSSSPSSTYVGQVARQKPQCTHLRRMASASRPCGVSRIQSARWVSIASLEVVHPAGIEDAGRVEGLLEAPVDLEQRRAQRMKHAERLVAAAEERGVAAQLVDGGAHVERIERAA